jgi:hypothetical protein
MKRVVEGYVIFYPYNIGFYCCYRYYHYSVLIGVSLRMIQDVIELVVIEK